MPFKIAGVSAHRFCRSGVRSRPQQAAVQTLDPQGVGQAGNPKELGENHKVRREEGVPDASQGRRRDRSRCFNNRRHLDKMQNDCVWLCIYQFLNVR